MDQLRNHSIRSSVKLEDELESAVSEKEISLHHSDNHDSEEEKSFIEEKRESDV